MNWILATEVTTSKTQIRRKKEKQLDTLPTIVYDNPCYFDKSYDNPLFVPTIDMHDNEEFCLESLYDNALDNGPMLLDDIL